MGCLDRSQLRLVETGSEGVEGDQRPALCELAFLEEVSDLQNNRWPDDTASQTTSMWLQQRTRTPVRGCAHLRHPGWRAPRALVHVLACPMAARRPRAGEWGGWGVSGAQPLQQWLRSNDGEAAGKRGLSVYRRSGRCRLLDHPAANPGGWAVTPQLCEGGPPCGVDNRGQLCSCAESLTTSVYSNSTSAEPAAKGAGRSGTPNTCDGRGYGL